MAKAQIDEGFAEEVQQSIKENAIEAKKNKTVNGVKI
jgi:hypothetical protein